MANHSLAAVLGFEISVSLEEIRCFRLYRPRQKRSGAGAQNLGEQIAKRPWLGQRNHVTFCHGVSFL
jgi:hypothetical protein